MDLVGDSRTLVWQGSRIVPGGAFALPGTTVSPEFDPADHETASRKALLAAYPGLRERMFALTR